MTGVIVTTISLLSLGGMIEQNHISLRKDNFYVTVKAIYIESEKERSFKTSMKSLKLKVRFIL